MWGRFCGQVKGRFLSRRDCRTLPRSGYTEQPRVLTLGLGGWGKGALKVAPEFERAGGTTR